MKYPQSFINFIKPIVSFISSTAFHTFNFCYDFLLESVNYFLTASFLFFILYQSRHFVLQIADITISYYLLIAVSSLLPLLINASTHIDGSKYWGFFEIIVCLKTFLLSIFNVSFLDLIALASVFLYIFQTPFLVALSSLFVVPQALAVSCIEGVLLFSRVRALVLCLFDCENYPRGLALINFLSICLILEFNTPIFYDFLSKTPLMESLDHDAYRLLQFSLSSPAISKSFHVLESSYHKTSSSFSSSDSTSLDSKTPEEQPSSSQKPAAHTGS